MESQALVHAEEVQLILKFFIGFAVLFYVVKHVLRFLPISNNLGPTVQIEWISRYLYKQYVCHAAT
jgi:hypothetical protein